MLKARFRERPRPYILQIVDSQSGLARQDMHEHAGDE